MATTTMVHVRVDERVKQEAAATLATMGLSVSDAVRVFLTRVVAEQQIPFAIKVPNAATRAAMAEVEAMIESGKPARFANGKQALDYLEQTKAPK